MTHEFNVNNKPEAHIERWSHIKLPARTLGYLMGSVSKHERQEEFRMPYQITSTIKRFEPEKGFMETENTFYTLGYAYSQEERQKESGMLAAEWQSAYSNGVVPPNALYDLVKS